MMSLLFEEVSYIYDVIINYSLWRGVNLLRGVCYVYDIIVIYLPLPEECECDTERHVMNTEGDWVTLCHRMLGGGYNCYQHTQLLVVYSHKYNSLTIVASSPITVTSGRLVCVCVCVCVHACVCVCSYVTVCD